MRLLATLIIIALGWASSTVRSQPVDVRDAILHFRDRLQARDFRSIESRHRELQRGPAKSAIGVVLADIYVDWAGIDHCYAIARNPDAAASRGWTTARCESYYIGLFDAWEKTVPETILPRLGRAWARMAAARSVDMDFATRRRALAEANQLLQAIPASRRTVDWYLTAIAVAMVSGAEQAQFEALVKEALARYPERPQLARTAIRHHLPAQGGTRAEALALADKMSRWVPPASADRIYAEAVEAYFEEADERPPSILGTPDFSWSRMRDGLLGRYFSHPNSWARNRIAMFACLARDADTLRKFLSDGGGEERSAWYPVGEEACRSLVRPLSPQSPAARTST